MLLQPASVCQRSRHLSRFYKSTRPVLIRQQLLSPPAGHSLHTTAIPKQGEYIGHKALPQKQECVPTMDPQGLNKARRNAAKSAQLPSGRNTPGTINPAAPAFPPFDHIPWNNFTTAAQDQTQYITRLAPNTPYAPVPNHRQMSRAPDQPLRPHNNNQQQPPYSNNKPTKPFTHRRTLSDRDTVVPPSPASGGVPDPSPSYLLRSSFLPQRTPSPHCLLVIIDLNGTLLHRPSRLRPHSFVARPHAREFLAYCLDTFSVMIWSSARMSNVQAMCADLLTPSQLSRVLAVWGREHFGLTKADYESRVQCYKRLGRVWDDERIQKGHPVDWDGVPDLAMAAEGNKVTPARKWDQGNTVLIDDSPEKARSEPFNAIHIPEFAGEEALSDAVLPKVHDYINTLACHADVSAYMRVNPFTVEG